MRTVVLIPTYNEKENLAEVVTRVLDAVPAADVLVIDDASPDGTGEIADRLSAGLQAAGAPSPTLSDAPVGLVIGSRWVPGGEVTNWPRRRVWLSRAANTYAGVVLGIRVKDSTAGFRVFRAEVLRTLSLGTIDSKGYCFQVDMTLRVLDAGYRVVELPINFHERQHGQSKMSGNIVLEAIWRITGWGWQRRVLRRRPRRS